MTPPDHLMAGLSVGAIYSSICGMFSVKRLSLVPVSVICGISAILPDADALRGVYSSTDPFIGHRGVTHSIFFVLSVAILFTCLYAVWLKMHSHYKSDQNSITEKFLWGDLFILIVISGITHLIMDLPQPPGVWKGIPLFFPLKNGDLFLRSGGWSYTGWYDYRVTFILLVSISVSFIFLTAGFFTGRILLIRKFLSVCVMIVCITSLFLITEHIRNSSFKGGKAWNESQRHYLEKFPPNVRKFTATGRSFILEFIH